MRHSTNDVTVIGAGPYGLGATAQLRAAGVETRIFGVPMSFWQENMPIGMRLRSPWEGTNIGNESGPFSLDRYAYVCGVPQVRNLSLADFVAYGMWVQRHAAPDVDRRKVSLVEKTPGGFRLTLEDGECVETPRVVVAAGIQSFARRPQQFDTLPPELASHSVDHSDLSQFAGQSVAVIGAGQSAMEGAVLLAEAGAEAEVIARESHINWLGRSARALKRLGPLEGPARKVVFPPADVGPPGLNWIISTPPLFKQLPRTMQRKIETRAIRPAAANWLRERANAIQITTGRHVVFAETVGNRARLILDDGSQRYVDHVLLSTGYRISIERYRFLSPDLAKRLKTTDGYPKLTTGFESTVPGLHFLGAPAALQPGPAHTFRCGQWICSQIANSGHHSGRLQRCARLA